ncbi:MAG: prepilin-type N-terminal cleavage/methylation domain-containing protein [Trichlorobacter sp.]|nr:prepilin-type N-terminal cleavage/methylation domain-containing protein [Trichlorobacter sp.]
MAVFSRKRHKRKLQQNSGFTLLELLVALAIGSLIIAAAYTVFFSINRAQEIAVTDMEQRRALRATMDLLRRELSSVLYRTGDENLRFLVEDRDFFDKPASNLSFTTIAPPADGGVSDQLSLLYQLSEKENEEENLQLIRIAKDFFLDEEQYTLTGYPIMEHLEGFFVECYDGSQWQKSWDTALTPVLPRSVRVTISLKDRDQVVSYSMTTTPKVVIQ